jgi:hypothetical protein
MDNISEISLIENVVLSFSPAILRALLRDHSTSKNIVWATDEYSELGQGYQIWDEISPQSITGYHAGVVKPRVTKSAERQAGRTKRKAEVFTPTWLCNRMNNYIDEQWFEHAGPFNTETAEGWAAAPEIIEFSNYPGKSWKDYVDCRKLEIACGEAPFICSRYDTVTGAYIPPEKRIGMLDRKLRVVSENTDSFEQWLEWSIRALQSTYGYEYQGDSLLIARINVLEDFADNMSAKWDKEPNCHEAQMAADIISWNLWQMDGLEGTVPTDRSDEDFLQMSIFDLDCDADQLELPSLCQIFDWRARKSQTYVSLKDIGGLK